MTHPTDPTHPTLPDPAPLSAEPASGPGRPLFGFWTMLVWGLGMTLRPRALLVALLVALGLGAASRLIVTEGGRIVSSEQLALNLWMALDFEVLHFLVPIAVLLLVGPAFSREVRERTLVYHLVRPVARSTLFLSRFVAGWIPAALIVWVLLASTCFFSPVELPMELYVQLALVAIAASFALGAIYYTLSIVFRRGLIVGLIYTFLAEVLLASLPGNMQRLSVRFHLRSLFHGLADSTFAPLSPKIAVAVERGHRPESLGSGEEGLSLFEQVPFDSPWEVALTLGILGAALLVVGGMVTARRDFPLKD